MRWLWERLGENGTLESGCLLENACWERVLRQQIKNSDADIVGAQRYVKERRSPHLLWTAPVTIDVDGVRHLGLVRDVSREGIGLHSTFCPKRGARLELQIRVPRSPATIFCVGTVVRAVSEGAGGATMIGIALEKFTIQGAAIDEHWSSITEALRRLRASEQSKLPRGKRA